MVTHLKKILCDGSELTAVNQVEYSIYLQRTELYDFCQKHGIFMQTFAPLLPCIVAAGGPVESLLASLSAKYGVARVEICIRWCIDNGLGVETTTL